MKDEQQSSSQEDQQEQISGRSIFMVETTAGGITVQTGFLAEDGRVIQMPAIFPTQEYALSQVDELRMIVIAHFTQAAQVGTQIISQVNQAANTLSEADAKGPCPEDTRSLEL